MLSAQKKAAPHFAKQVFGGQPMPAALPVSNASQSLKEGLKQAKALIKKRQFQKAYDQLLDMVIAHGSDLHLIKLMAEASYETGRFSETKGWLDRADAMTAKDAQICYLKGNLVKEEDRYEDALRHYEAALAINPKHDLSLFHAGICHHMTGAPKEAMRYYDRAKRQQLQNPDLYYNRGLLQTEAGDIKAALAEYQAALRLNPNFAKALSNIGVIHKQAGELDKAVSFFQRALKASPNYGIAMLNLADTLQDAGQLAEARTLYARYMEMFGTDATVLGNTGACLYSLARYDEAIDCFEKALAEQPDNPVYWHNLGISAYELGQHDRAMDAYDKALALRPNYPSIFANRGNILRQRGDLEAALNDYMRAIDLNPAIAEAHLNAGVIYRDRMEIDRAIQFMDQAIACQPGFADAHLIKGMCLLVQEKFTQGWQDFESRWGARRFESKRLETKMPAWKAGQPKADRLLVWSEQGLGDEVMFASLYPRLGEIAGHAIIQIDPRLLGLFGRSFPHLDFRPKKAAISQQDYDAHMPAGSLPAVWLSSQADFASLPQGYLQADPERTSRYRAELAKSGRPVWGISWHSKNREVGGDRSLDLTRFLELVNRPDVLFVNLQYGEMSDQLARARAATGCDIVEIDEVDNFRDIDGLAALVSACDRVVSIDNSTVHLAGALGIQTDVLLPFSPDWRWGCTRQTSLWYPSVRLHRPASLTDRSWQLGL